MNACQHCTENLVAFLGRELDAETAESLKEHLAACPDCRSEFEAIRKVLREADSFHEEVGRVLATVDWEAVARQTVGAVFQKESRAVKQSGFEKLLSRLFPQRLRPVYAGVLAGLLLGFLGAYLVLNPGLVKPRKGEAFSASRDFLEKVELEMARRETLDYLQKSQYVLLDFVQSPSQGKKLEPSVFSSRQARDLLSKKKYLNRELDRFQMAKAKQICDQIEILFFELAQISGDLSQAELRRIQSLIEDKQLLLKINLVKKELEKSEV
jgi:hypothetical protein